MATSRTFRERLRQRVRGLRFPHPLTLLTVAILAAAALSYVLPAGEYDRRDDPVTGRSVVVPGTFHEVEANRIGAFEAIVAIPRGMADRADVVFLIFLIGGAFAVFDATGALRRGVTWLMLLTKRLGYSPMVGVAVSAGSAFVGSAFSPINPFQVQIAQKVSDVALLSGWAFRLAFLAIALGLWIWWTMRYAARTRAGPEAEETTDVSEPDGALGWRDVTIFAIVVSTFVVLVWGLLRWEWEFDHMSALFFIMGVAVGIIGRLGVTGTAHAYAEGFRSMGYAALLIGFANAIYVVMDDGRIIDTIVRGLFVPLADLPLALSAIGMSAAQGVLHFAVPSVSGQAVLTLPVLVPLSDLLGLSRQITILAYQYGAGLCELITPTNGALMAILAASGVRYESWLRFVIPRYLMLMALGAVALVIALAIGYS
ncbi:MAG: YfcC family protein [Gemmatimonadales bacterium]|nr:YfcC family protein [Gemmatimonadales bacterium]